MACLISSPESTGRPGTASSPTSVFYNPARLTWRRGRPLPREGHQWRLGEEVRRYGLRLILPAQESRDRYLRLLPVRYHARLHINRAGIETPAEALGGRREGLPRRPWVPTRGLRDRPSCLEPPAGEADHAREPPPGSSAGTSGVQCVSRPAGVNYIIQRPFYKAVRLPRISG